jgi:hypothetical protein
MMSIYTEQEHQHTGRAKSLQPRGIHDTTSIFRQLHAQTHMPLGK